MEFKTGDFVLCRDDRGEEWYPFIFCEMLEGNEEPFLVFNGQTYRQCIPLKGNEHLVRKTGVSPDWDGEPEPELTEYGFLEPVEVLVCGEWHQAVYVKISNDRWDRYPHQVLYADDRITAWVAEKQVRRAVRSE